MDKPIIKVTDYEDLAITLEVAMDALIIACCSLPDPPELIVTGVATRDGCIQVKTKVMIGGRFEDKKHEVGLAVKNALLRRLSLHERPNDDC